MMTRQGTFAACLLAVLLGSSAAVAQHGPGDEGTPDPQPRRVELEAPPRAETRQGPRAEAALPRRPPRTLPYYEWSPIPYGYRLKMGSGRSMLLTTGVVVLASAHIASQVTGLLVATAGCGDEHRLPVKDCGKHVAELQAPVVGPWLAFAGHGNAEPKWFYPILGSVQVAGFAMIMVGATLDDKRLVREDKFFPLATKVSVTPTIGPGNYGLSVGGSF